MKNDWYYMSKSQKHGPVSSRRLKDLADEGTLLPDDLIWTPAFSEWKPASFLKALFPSVREMGPSITNVELPATDEASSSCVGSVPGKAPSRRSRRFVFSG
jgi:hypothetical protein